MRLLAVRGGTQGSMGNVWKMQWHLVIVEGSAEKGQTGGKVVAVTVCDWNGVGVHVRLFF